MTFAPHNRRALLIGGFLSVLETGRTSAKVAQKPTHPPIDKALITATAKDLGVSTAFLVAMLGLAEKTDVTSASVIEGIHGLARTIYEAEYGRNNIAAAGLSQLGVKYPEFGKDQPVDYGPTIIEVSRAIFRQQNPYLQERIAETLDASGILPILRKGPDVIAAETTSAKDFLGD